jgi:2-hydroxycyclohexanecarboxyl-CoA dehydrogenase
MGTRAFLDDLLQAGTGRVGSTGETVYAAAKGGVIAFSKSLAREMARKGITVNCVCPGPTATPMLMMPDHQDIEALTRAIPMRRLAEPATSPAPSPISPAPAPPTSPARCCASAAG